MIGWDTIDTVLLDMDGTLLDLHFDNFFWQEYVPQCYAEQRGMTLSAAKAQLDPKFNALTGRLEWYCLDYWARELELDIMAMKRTVRHLIQFRPHTPFFLQQLQAMGKTVIMVTNAHRDNLSLKLECVSLGHYFDRMISSHDYGYPKESPSFWSELKSDISLDKDRALFVDDSISVLSAAKTFSIAHLLAIRYPDSQKGAWETGDYEAVTDFRDLFHEC